MDMAMRDLEDRLARLGLNQYCQVFADEGFDNWEVLLDITECDLNHLGVKLGHRRKLQRAIAESRRQCFGQPLLSTPRSSSMSTGGDKCVKRKDRRHSKSDEHAPRQLSSALPMEEHDTYRQLEKDAKERYLAELAEYKGSPRFEAYERYTEAEGAEPLKGPSLSTGIPLSVVKPLHTHGFFVPSRKYLRSTVMQSQPPVKTLSCDPRQDARSSTEVKLLHRQLPPFATLFSYPTSVEYQKSIELRSRLPRGEIDHVPLLDQKDPSSSSVRGNNYRSVSWRK
ncbi:hypothetical protein T440DRAFT_527147 [Plenodomus tracheiphilus IPT5]|uniref:SAM domain-containing protein n=1 Tax=Plenodomus tracheiphilus IPT5 TaxID=1408161 RepID=A0A6A7ALZ9_9PLEO|nr:hypothetical protein T440DRAFT_527147 [Plenodomus tracheiphilus IPT5]